MILTGIDFYFFSCPTIGNLQFLIVGRRRNFEGTGRWCQTERSIQYCGILRQERETGPLGQDDQNFGFRHGN